MPRTTIEISEEHRDFLDKLAHGQLKRLISGLLDCTLDLSAKYGERMAVAYVSAGIMQLTEAKDGGNRDG